MKIIVTGGGTGGHIYPALAVAQALKKQDAAVQVEYIGGDGGPEAAIVPATGTPFHPIEARKLRRILSISTVGVLVSLLRGYLQAAALCRRLRPNVVVSTGGYVAAAAAIAAARQGIPLLTQACDAVPGRTNLLLARWATRLCIWFESTAAMLPRDRCVVTGVPLRDGIVSPVTPHQARLALGLSEHLPTLFVTGGSQGAQALNARVVDAAQRLGERIQVLHQTGERNLAEVTEAARTRHLNPDFYHVRPTLSGEEMPLAYRAADIVVCRAGISTLAEVTANGLPALMVPLPTAYADHQTANARCVESAGAGVLLPQSELTGESLAEAVERLLNDSEARERIAQASRALGKPNAASDVARLARDLAK